MISKFLLKAITTEKENTLHIFLKKLSNIDLEHNYDKSPSYWTTLAGIPKDIFSLSSHLIVTLSWYHLYKAKYACQLTKTSK